MALCPRCTRGFSHSSLKQPPASFRLRFLCTPILHKTRMLPRSTPINQDWCECRPLVPWFALLHWQRCSDLEELWMLSEVHLEPSLQDAMSREGSTCAVNTLRRILAGAQILWQSLETNDVSHNWVGIELRTPCCVVSSSKVLKDPQNLWRHLFKGDAVVLCIQVGWVGYFLWRWT